MPFRNGNPRPIEMARSFAQENQINEAKTVFNKPSKNIRNVFRPGAKEELNRLN